MNSLKNIPEKFIVERYNRPLLFYFSATLGTWTAWFLAAWISGQAATDNTYDFFVTLLLLLGLLFPFFASWSLTRKDPILRADFWERLTRFGEKEARFSLVAVLIMLLSILLAQLISLFFGYSANQFAFNFNPSFSAGLISGWAALIIAPIIEEMSWHCYGTDTLRRKFNLMMTSLVFAIYWIVWHVPLGFVEGYYQANVVESGALYTFNMILSIVPFVIIMNWCYYKSNRSVLVAIICHLFAGIFNEIFNTHPMSKVIQTSLLILVCMILITRDQRFFFSSKINYDRK